MADNDPREKRADADIEAQRLEAIDIVRSHREKIFMDAASYGVPADAIAGAILWEAIENPYHRSIFRLGPGKVHPDERFKKSEAEKVEEERRVTPATSVNERATRLRQPDWAIAYIAAIMARHAENYKKIAGFDISRNSGVLCTLYQCGDSEGRAQKLADRRKTDPAAQPVPGDRMAHWVARHQSFIRETLGPEPAPAPTPSPTSPTPPPPSLSTASRWQPPHTVAVNDSLSKIAGKRYNDQMLWPLIHDANRDKIGSNHNLILPGWVLKIPSLDGLTAAELDEVRRRGRHWRHP